MFESQNPEKINIKNLSVEELERREHAFDPAELLTKKDWESIKKEKKTGKLHEGNNALYLMYLKMLNPELANEIAADKWQEFYDYVKVAQLIAGANNDIPFPHGTTLISAIKVLFGERLEELGIRNDDQQFWRDLNLNQYFDNKVWGSFSIAAFEALTLFPKARLSLNDESYEGIKSKVEDLLKLNNITRAIERAGELKFLFPKRAQLKLSSEELAKIHGLLGQYSSEDWVKRHGWNRFLQLAAWTRVLAAEEAKITENGLEINMSKPKKDFLRPTPPMPEIRKF